MTTKFGRIEDEEPTSGQPGPSGSPATVSNPITNEVVVFASTANNPPEMKSSSTISTMAYGLSTNRLDIIPIAANPGSTGTVWLNSGTGNSLMFGASNVLTNTSPTSANSIPVYSNGTGQVDTATTDNVASLARPVSIIGSASASAGNFTIATFQKDKTNARTMMYLSNSGNGGGNRGTGIRMGPTAGQGVSKVWEFGNDSAVNGTDDWYVWSGTLSGYALKVANTGLMTMTTGVAGPRYDVSPVASKPAGAIATTLWANSTVSSVPQWGDDFIMTDTSPAPAANKIPVSTGTGGKYDTLTNSTTAELNRPLQITQSGNNARIYMYNTTGGDNKASFLFGKDPDGVWEWGTASTGDKMFLYSKTRLGDVLQVAASDGLVNPTVGAKTTRYDITPVAANPGSTPTLWSKSTDSDRLYHGANKLALYSDVSGSLSNTTVNVPITWISSNPINLVKESRWSISGRIVSVHLERWQVSYTGGNSTCIGECAIPWTASQAPIDLTGFPSTYPNIEMCWVQYQNNLRQGYMEYWYDSGAAKMKFKMSFASYGSPPSLAKVDNLWSGNGAWIDGLYLPLTITYIAQAAL